MTYYYTPSVIYILESSWAQPGCNGPPDSILNTSSIIKHSTWGKSHPYPFNAGFNSLLDLTDPKVCSTKDASFSCYQNNFVTSEGDEEKNLLVGANGNGYCRVRDVSQNDTILLLNSLGKCYSGYAVVNSSVTCNGNTLKYFSDKTCATLTDSISLTSSSELVTTTQNSTLQVGLYTVEKAETKIIFWEYFPYKLPLDSPSSVLILFYMTIGALFPLCQLIYYAWIYSRLKRVRYIYYMVGSFLWILTLLLAGPYWLFKFTAPIIQILNAELPNLFLLLASSFTTGLNTYNVFRLVIQSWKIRIPYIVILFGYWVWTALPLGLEYTQYDFGTNPTSFWIFWQWVYPTTNYWGIFCIIYDPLTAIGITVYILYQFVGGKIGLVDLVRYDYKYAMLIFVETFFVIVFMVFLVLQHSTLVFETDRLMASNFVLFILLAEFNAMLSIELTEAYTTMVGTLRLLKSRDADKITYDDYQSAKDEQLKEFNEKVWANSYVASSKSGGSIFSSGPNVKTSKKY